MNCELQRTFEAYRPHRVIAGLGMSSHAPGLVSTRLDGDQIDPPLRSVIPDAHTIEGASYVHALVVAEKAPRSECDLLTSDDDIPAGVSIVKITAELDETFMSIGNIFVDYWPRASFLVTYVVKRQRHKNAGVISQV